MNHHSRHPEATVDVKCYHCDNGYVVDGTTYRICPECGGMGKVTMDAETGLMLKYATITLPQWAHDACVELLDQYDSLDLFTVLDHVYRRCPATVSRQEFNRIRPAIVEFCERHGFYMTATPAPDLESTLTYATVLEGAL